MLRTIHFIILIMLFLPVFACAEASPGTPELSADVPFYLPADGTPFWISVNFTGEPDSVYRLGGWIYSKNYPAEFWNGEKWVGGTRYCYISIQTDSSGYWSGHIAMRISKMPEKDEYYLKIKVKDSQNNTVVEHKILHEGNFSIIPASECGWIEGYAERDGEYLSGRSVEIYDSNGFLAGRTVSENNGIEDYREFSGYFCFALPAGVYDVLYPGGEFRNVSVAKGKVNRINNRSFSYEVHNITTFVSPDCSFDIISSMILSAEQSIYLNMYEFTNPFLYEAVLNRLQNNVSVRILMEESPVRGMKDTEKWIIRNLEENGACIRFWDKPKGTVYNHAKYAIIDNRTILVGSANWVLTGVPSNPTYGNREWMVAVHDEKMAHGLLDVFEYDWLYAKNTSFGDGTEPSRKILSGNYDPVFNPANFIGNFSAKLIFSPENSLESIITLIRSASHTLYIEQMCIYRYWDGVESPLVSELLNARARGVDVRVILNYNKVWESNDWELNTNTKIARYLRNNNISVKLFETGEKGWGIFTSVHNKGVIVDNHTVLVSSINWNENSVRRNRELGIIIENESIARYYANVFFHDWSEPDVPQAPHKTIPGFEGAAIIFLFLVIALWRYRRWA